MSEDMQKLHDAVLQLGDAALEIATALSAFMGSDDSPPWPNTGEPTIAGTGTGLVEPAPEDEAPHPQRFPAEIDRKFRAEIDRWAEERCDVKQQDHVMSQHSLWMSYCRWTADTARAVKLTRNEFWSTLQKSRHRNRLAPRSFVVSEPAERPGKEPWRAPPEEAKSYATGATLSASRAEARIKAAHRASGAGYDFEGWCRKVRSVRTQMNVGTSGFAEILGVSPGAVSNWETGVCFAKSATRSQLERMAAHLCGTPREAWKQGHPGLPL